MASLAYVCAAMQIILTTVANTAARTTEFIRRQRQRTGASFVHAVVFRFLAKPTMSFDHLAQTATAVGTPISAHGLDHRFTPAAAACLHAVLGAAVQHLVSAHPVAIPLLERFAGVYLLDRSTIMVPDALHPLWHGNGGSTTVGTQRRITDQKIAPDAHITLPDLPTDQSELIAMIDPGDAERVDLIVHGADGTGVQTQVTYGLCEPSNHNRPVAAQRCDGA